MCIRDRVSTVGDELKMSGQQSKVIGVSIKDRAAILPAGHMADGAYWFDDKSGHWVTSTYYKDAVSYTHLDVYKRQLLGPVKWTYFYLYVILDVFSRYVVGWMVADGESAALAKRLIGDTCEKEKIQPDELTIHADRGSSMTSKSVALLMACLLYTSRCV